MNGCGVAAITMQLSATKKLLFLASIHIALKNGMHGAGFPNMILANGQADKAAVDSLLDSLLPNCLLL